MAGLFVARRRDPSPNVRTGSPSHKVDENRLLQSGPKFGKNISFVISSVGLASLPASRSSINRL